MTTSADGGAAGAGAALRDGEALTHFAVGATRETRFDTPDRPMSGAMDPFFFVTRTKNFIPHEYPCRTAFAAERRGRRPAVDGAFAPQRNVLPFGADRLDLSGFWFRPTYLATWARTRVQGPGGTVRLGLATAGGAVLFVNGEEAGWLAPYTRNLEAEREITVTLPAGESTLDVFFDDLAERDTRYTLRIDWRGGAPVIPLLPFEADPAKVRAVEAALGAMHFHRPHYTGGTVRIALPVPLPGEAAADITVEGDFMSHERLSLSRTVPAGADGFDIAEADALPADFRHFSLAFTLDGFTARRTLGVEIAHAERQGEPAASLDARIAEALDHVATRSERDTVCALARLATGRGGPQTDAMIDEALGPIGECWDCADFALVPLLWARMRYAEAIGEAVRARVDATILGYRYWMDEPGNDVQWYFSENHALLFHTAAYLAGTLFPGATFARSGRDGAAQSAAGAERVRAWLDHFERWEMAEFNSAPYFPIDLKGLTALFALAPDADIRVRAGRAIARLVEILANSAHHGVLTGAQGRSYEHTLRAALSLELSAIARLLWRRGTLGTRFHALPQLALCLREHGLALPDLAQRAVLREDGEQEWCFAQGAEGFAALMHVKTRHFALGTAARYRWYEWGYQETLVQARIGEEPQAQVFINHPGELIQCGYGRPSYWGGSASVPRVQQYRGLAIVVFRGVAPQPDFTHAWFPAPVFDAARVEGRRALAARDGGVLLLAASGPLEPVTAGPSAHCELRLPGRHGVWLLRADGGVPLDAFAERVAGLCAPRVDDPFGAIVVDDPAYGTVRFLGDGTVEAEGERVDPSQWTVRGERRVRPPPHLR